MNERYRVFISSDAQNDINSIYRYILRDNFEAAEHWQADVKQLIRSLAEFPNRNPLAPESSTFDEEIRHAIYGKGFWRYRILFAINQDGVIILHVRHGARQTMRPGMD